MTAVSRGLARFEQLDDARQTAGDVLGLGRLARDLREHVARRAPSSPSSTIRWARDGMWYVRIDLVVLAADLDRGCFFSSGESMMIQLRQAGDLVHLLVHRHAFDDVLEADRARLLR